MWITSGCVTDVSITTLASMAKFFPANHLTRPSRSTTAPATSPTHPIERYYRDARITNIDDGTKEIQKNIIVDQLLYSDPASIGLGR